MESNVPMMASLWKDPRPHSDSDSDADPDPDSDPEFFLGRMWGHAEMNKTIPYIKGPLVTKLHKTTSPFLIRMMLYSANAALFEPNWNPAGMMAVMNPGHVEIPTVTENCERYSTGSSRLPLMKHHDCCFLCLSFSKINLENTLVFHSFRQIVTKAHGFVGETSAGSYASCLRCSNQWWGLLFHQKKQWTNPLGCARYLCPAASLHNRSEFLVSTLLPWALHYAHYYLYSILSI